MKAALYAVRTAGRWRLMVSLDLRVDVWWWTGENWMEGSYIISGVQIGEIQELGRAGTSARADKLVILSRQLPLGWAVLLRDRFAAQPEMNRWSLRDWRRYMLQALSSRL